MVAHLLIVHLDNGGYSKKILENKKNKIFAIDRDSVSIKIINQFKKNIKIDLNLKIKNLVKF